MLQFAFAGAEPVGDLAQGTGLPQLTEQHGDKLVPTGKTLGPKVGFEIAGVVGEIGTLKKSQDLAKKTAG